MSIDTADGDGDLVVGPPTEAKAQGRVGLHQRLRLDLDAVAANMDSTPRFAFA